MSVHNQDWLKPVSGEVQTVREQLVEALEWGVIDGHTFPCPAGWGPRRKCSERCIATRAAIERARREPEEPHDLDTCIGNAQEAGRI